MPGNDEVLWLQPNLNMLAYGKALEAIAQTGRALPSKVTAVNGALVTVQIEATGPWTIPLLTIPKAESQWLRAPVQVGDVGLTLPADTFLGGISGQGSGVANLETNYGNLTTLVWIPCAATTFGVSPDANKAWVNGPNGAVASDTAQTVVSAQDATTRSVSHTVHNPQGAGATIIQSILDGINNRSTHSLTNELGTVETILDGVENKITHSLMGAAGPLVTIFDGNGNALSHVVPTGGILALGALASSLGAARAVPAQADLTTLSSNLMSQSIQSLMSIMSAAMITAAAGATTPTEFAVAFEAIVTAANWITSHITFPTIPDCSSLVRLAP